MSITQNSANIASKWSCITVQCTVLNEASGYFAIEMLLRSARRAMHSTFYQIWSTWSLGIVYLESEFYIISSSSLRFEILLFKYNTHRDLNFNSHKRFCTRDFATWAYILDYGESKKRCLSSCRNKSSHKITRIF